MQFKKTFLLTLAASFLTGCDRSPKEHTFEHNSSNVEPLSFDSFIEEQLALPSQYRNFLKLHENYRKRAESNPLEALEDLESHSEFSPAVRGKITAMICAEWASKDHQAAFAYLESLQGDGKKAKTWQTMLFNASESYFQSLLDYYPEVPKGSLQNGSATFIVRKLAQDDINAAYQWAFSNIEQPQLSKTVSELFQMALREDITMAIHFLDSITASEYRQPVVEQLAQILGEIDTTEAFTWFESLQTSQDKEAAYPLIFGEYFKQQPLSAISDIAQLSEGNLKNQMMRKFVPALIHGQSKAALKWIKELDPSLPSTAVARQKFVGVFCRYDEELAMENAIAFAGDDQDYLKSLLLEMARYEPGLIAPFLQQYEGEAFHQKLISRLIKGYTGKSSAEMENWVSSVENPEVRVAVIAEAWPIVIDTDPQLAISFLAEMPSGEARANLVNDVARELKRLEPESEYVFDCLENLAELPSELQEALSFFDSKSNLYIIPE